MFRRISYSIALRFTAFVCLLMLINGALFLAADYGNAMRLGRDRLLRSSHVVMRETEGIFLGREPRMPPELQQRVRVITPENKVLFSGNIYNELPVNTKQELQTFVVNNERYMVFNRPIIRGEEVVGYIQVAGFEAGRASEIPQRALIFLAVTAAVSALTFAVGLLFARNSLKPAERAMRRLEQFTQDASHELRTPLAALSSSLDLALKKGSIEKGVRSAKEEVQRIVALTDKLMDLARLDSLGIHTTHVDMSALVQRTVEQYEQSANEAGVELQKIIAKDISVQGDEALLVQAIGNLLSNAIKFRGSKNAFVKIELTNKGLQISDNGIGIPTDELDRIFDRFYQADASRSHEGFGLGLSLVQRIIQLHGWSIDVQSSGHGTAFTVQFP